ncbi:S24 family peptidase [Pandoraea sp. SD6-2]|uniref:S24 family peptidase n=1 Tax=Pandoraea sp. SD6-2 TaxID=1286093 RepID=UPI00032D7709|nr:S24 family peptidase [Pandoraea sp. SD6-2]EON13128.1 putative phage repressor [Pandoraea sp. SD6-2]
MAKTTLLPWQIEDAARLKALFKVKSDLSQEAFGAKFEIGSQGMVWQYLNARSPLNAKAAAGFARGLGVSIADFSPTLAKQAMSVALHISPALRNYEGPPPSDVLPDVSELTDADFDDPTSAAAHLTRFDFAKALADEIEIPRFDVRASMGNGFPMPDYDNVVEQIRVTRTWVRDTLPNVSSPRNLALLPAFGDSMEGTFNDGDLLWVDRGVVDVKVDAIYVLALRDELYVKRLQRRPDGSILMISDNKKYEPYLIQNGEREKFKILGRVVYAWRGTKL